MNKVDFISEGNNCPVNAQTPLDEAQMSVLINIIVYLAVYLLSNITTSFDLADCTLG